jgi:hypothetical protein
LKHLPMLSTGIAISLSLTFITACASRQQSNQPPAQTSPQPAVSPSLATGATNTSFQKWKSSQVVDAFRTARLEIENPRLMTKPKDYGSSPMNDVEGTQFTLPSLGEDTSGHIYNFASENELERMVKYYADASANNFSWVLVKDNILVQIDGRLTEERVKQYEIALGNLK